MIPGHTSPHDGSDLHRVTVEGREVVVTDCETSVALLAAQGRSNREIAMVRNSSPKTVANQLASVYKKLGIESREQPARNLSGMDER